MSCQQSATTPQPSQATPSLPYKPKYPKLKGQTPSPSSLSHKRQCHTLRLFCSFYVDFEPKTVWHLKLVSQRRAKS